MIIDQVPPLPNDATQVLRGDGTWGAAPVQQGFPVGSIFVSAVSTNPNTLLGYGTWSAISAGRVLVGYQAGDPDFGTLGATGGEKTHTLTTPEIPSHTHVQDSHNHTQDAHTHVQNSHNHVQDAHTHTQNSHNHIQDAHSHTVPSVGSSASGASTNLTGTSDTSSTTATTSSVTATNQAATAVNQNATATNQAATATNQNTGGGGAHNNLQPFLVVTIWQRTA